jgi:hypothetical protein
MALQYSSSKAAGKHGIQQVGENIQYESKYCTMDVIIFWIKFLLVIAAIAGAAAFII